MTMHHTACRLAHAFLGRPLSQTRTRRYITRLLLICLPVTSCASSSSSSDEPPPTAAEMLDIAGQSIPEWHVGVEGGIPDYANRVDVTTLGAIADDDQDDTDAFEAAITQTSGQGAVYIPEGQFQLSRTLTLPSYTVLRGTGSTTELLIQHSDDAFQVQGSGDGNADAADSTGLVAVLSGATKGSMQIEVSDASSWAVGDGIELVQGFDDDVHLTQSDWDVDWGKRLVGHFSEVLAIQGKLITLADPVRIDMDLSKGIWVAPVSYTHDSGFEHFRVVRDTTNSGHIFNLQYTSNIWLKGIESDNANRCHLTASQGRRLEVRDSQFQNASSYGSGGHGYGVDLSSRQTGSLVINNRFSFLRHALVLHLGANGNVVAYNASSDTVQDEGGNWLPDDLTLHGHYAYSNLMESNQLEGISISDYWGPTGPDNVFLRNSLQRDPVAAYDQADEQILIGNRLPEPGFELDDTIDQSSWSLIANSYALNGEPIDNISSDDIPDSLFLETAPDFYGDSAWPSLGTDLSSTLESLPAQLESLPAQ